MSKSKLLVLNLLLTAVFGCLVCEAAAQQASVAVTPASIDATVKPGSSYTQSFTLTNSTGTPLRFRCSAADMWYDEQNRRMNGRAGTLPRSASLWMQFTPSEITVPAFGSGVVKVVITVPSNVTGSFYAVPVFEAMPTDKAVVQTGNSTASIGIRFRGLIMLTTERGSEYNVEMMGGKITSPSASAELGLAMDLRNRGTAHTRVRGTFAILNPAGALLGRGNIEEKRFLPTQRDLLKSNWSGNLPAGTYTCVVVLSYNRVGQEPVSLVNEIPFLVK